MNLSGDKMAQIEEILQLDKIQSSIKKIDLFLSQKTKYSNEYMKALCYKGSILHELGKTNEALKLLYEYIPSLSVMDSEAVICLCSQIIDITIDVSIFDQAIKYIKIKQKYLPISRQTEYIKDIVTLYLKKKDYENAKEALQKYLEDDITKDEEIYALEKLSRIYYAEKSFDKYLECIPKLEAYYQNNLDLKNQEEIQKNKIEISFQKKNYIQVIADGMQFFHDYDPVTNIKLIVASYLIRSYIEVTNYKKASIVESNYEEFISSEYPVESLEFCKASLELYNRTNTASSVIEYHRKIEDLEKLLHKEDTPVKKTKSHKKVDTVIEIPKLEGEILPDSGLIKNSEEDTYFNPIGILNPTKEELPIQKQKVELDIQSVKNIVVSNNFLMLDEMFSSMLQIEASVKFRECFRKSAIALIKEYPIEEMYLLYFDSEFKGLHYKTERCYDKKPRLENLEGSVGYQAYLTGTECFLDNSDRTYSKDIVKAIDYPDIVFAISIPLNDSVGIIGSLTFISTTPFLQNDLCYESIRLFQKVINYRLLESIALDHSKLEVQKMAFIQENMSSGIIENQDGYYHLSERAQEILGTIEVLTKEDYFMHMESSDIASYKAILNELYNLKTKGLELIYLFKRKNDTISIKERFYPLYQDGKIIIYSLIDDITESQIEKDNLTKLALTNPISNMQTLVKLTNDLVKTYDNKKSSLAIIDVCDSKLYKDIYGLNFYNQVIKAVGMKLTDAFSNKFDIEVYHLEGTTYAVYFFNTNDRRIVDSYLKDALEHASIEMQELNRRVIIHFNAGVFRLNKSINLKDPQDMISYASDALIDASSMNTLDNHISHYDSHLAKERFYQNSLITAISEAIDTKRLSLLYKQLIDLESSKVLGFCVSLNLDNYEVEEDKFDYVVKRRGLTVALDKYLLQNAFVEQKMFYSDFKAYLNLYIPVSSDTLDDKYVEQIKTHASFFKVDPKYFTFIVDHVTPNLYEGKDLGYHIASYDILDVYRGLCDYFAYDYHKVSKDAIPEIIELCNKHNVTLLFFGMDNKEDIDLARENGYQYVFGNYFKKLVRMRELIKNLKKK